MTCREAGMREDAAFAELTRAVEHRQHINARLAIYDDHWEGYENALADLEAAVQAYSIAVSDLRKARALHI